MTLLLKKILAILFDEIEIEILQINTSGVNSQDA